MLEEAKCLWETKPEDEREEREEERGEREVPRALAGVSLQLVKKVREKERKMKVKNLNLQQATEHLLAPHRALY